ncbi:hypothetical protein GGR52DRAFT_409296 [Hypoxylon sp. FL1284]|nr:hypothetical protein GGR52DRAFT_409296 [Hypoxylon sp. FL1284]
MELTPIKVRGKRCGPVDFPAVTPKRIKPKVKSVLKRKAKQSIQAKASVLEKKIPLEVMERIFWLSSNMNLPRASPLIGRLLSGRSTLQMTFISAFEPTWDCEWDSYRCRSSSGSGLLGNPTLQSDILACPWANISFILECWDAYVQRRAKRHAMGTTGGTDNRLRLRHAKIWGQFSTNEMTPENTGYIDCLAEPERIRQCFFDDYAAFQGVEDQNRNASFFRTEKYVHSYIHVHPDTRIPDALLTPPLDEESLQKLFWLVRSGAQLAADQTWETTLETFYYAVPLELPNSGQLNLTVVRLLALLGAFETWPKHVLADERDRVKLLKRNITGMLTSELLRKSLKSKYDYTLSKISQSDTRDP